MTSLMNITITYSCIIFGLPFRLEFITKSTSECQNKIAKTLTKISQDIQGQDNS
jgi:hypothetical protein